MSHSFPLVRSLPRRFSIAEAFDKLAQRPGCLWLDSSSHDRPSDCPQLARYSFLTSDPVETLMADLDGPNPWPTLAEWCRRLPSDRRSDLPPFQGGIAGLLGYESATWLEPIGVARTNDLPTPPMVLGWYDWTIATDHELQQSWIICQGRPDTHREQRYESALERLATIQRWLEVSEPAEREQPQRDTDDAFRSDQTDPCRATRATAIHQFATRFDGIQSNLTGERFRDSVSEIVQRICRGDSFQVNLSQRLLTRAKLPSPRLYRRLRTSNPSPFAAFFRAAGFEVMSTSPERFLSVRDRCVQTRPIKGTVARTGDPTRDRELARLLEGSEKDRAENIMIVDLMRNDLSRVCDDDSVRVVSLCGLERYEYVQHLVSVVEGKLSPNKTVADLLQACFPGGSVTGAPKIEAMRTIAALEPTARGPYCGAIGYIGYGGDADFNILIRTVTAAHGYLQIPVGGGVTARSDPEQEEAETWTKAEGMLRAVREASEVGQRSPKG